MGCEAQTPLPTPPTPPTAAEAGAEAGVEEVVQALARDPAEAARLLERSPDPVRQQGLLWALVAQDVARAAPLCAHLTREALRQDCHSLTNRPHLFVSAVRAGPHSPASASPPQATSRLRVPSDLAVPHPEEDPPTGACAEPLGADLCRLQQAEAALRQPGGSALAGGWCHQIGATLWREECHFRVADGLMMQRAEVYAVSAAFCLHAGSLTGRCLERLQEGIGLFAPPADAPPADWAAFQAQRAALRRFWQEHWPEGADLAEQALIAAAVTAAVGRSPQAGGVALCEALGPEAAPHVRAVLAALLIRDNPSTTASLAALAEQVEAELARAPRASSAGAPRAQVLEAPDLWLLSEQDAQSLSVVPYLLNGRRLLADDDPAADAAIAVLEAAARWSASAAPLLAEGVAHPDARVRATASRLQRHRQSPQRPPAISVSPTLPPAVRP